LTHRREVAGWWVFCFFEDADIPLKPKVRLKELKSLCEHSQDAPSAAKQFAEKVKGGTSGAEAPDDRASFMSELKLRPPKKTDFFRKL
jgi:hypothetical protein